jgi:5-aminolevulinate synthase
MWCDAARGRDRCKAASDLLLNRHSIYIQPINHPTVPIGTDLCASRYNEAHVSRPVEALVDVWKALGLPFTTAQIVPLRRRMQPPNVSVPRSVKQRNSLGPG